MRETLSNAERLTDGRNLWSTNCTRTAQAYPDLDSLIERYWKTIPQSGY